MNKKSAGGFVHFKKTPECSLLTGTTEAQMWLLQDICNCFVRVTQVQRTFFYLNIAFNVIWCLEKTAAEWLQLASVCPYIIFHWKKKKSSEWHSSYVMKTTIRNNNIRNTGWYIFMSFVLQHWLQQYINLYSWGKKCIMYNTSVFHNCQKISKKCM